MTEGGNGKRERILEGLQLPKEKVKDAAHKVREVVLEPI